MDDDARLHFFKQRLYSSWANDITGMVRHARKPVPGWIPAYHRDGGAVWMLQQGTNDMKTKETTASNDKNRVK